VLAARPFYLAVAGRAALGEALDAGDGVVEVDVLGEGTEGEVSAGTEGTASSMVAQAAEDPSVRRWDQDYGLDFAGLRRYVAASRA
jgi:hypothetical protein